MSELIYGINTVKTAIAEGVKINDLFILEGNKELITYSKEHKIFYKIVDKKFLDQKARNHQGVIANIDEFRTFNLEDIIISDKPNLIIILEGLEDPHNLGAILRTADAAGVSGIIIPRHRSVSLNSTVAKVSTGAIFTVKTVEVVNINQTIEKLKESGYWIVGAEVAKTSVAYDSIKYDMPTALIIGSEGKGISRLVKSKCDYLVEIPMKGKLTSLNASVSCGILVYEIIKDQ